MGWPCPELFVPGKAILAGVPGYRSRCHVPVDAWYVSVYGCVSPLPPQKKRSSPSWGSSILRSVIIVLLPFYRPKSRSNHGVGPAV